MALRPINYKKAVKAEDKINKKDAKARVKAVKATGAKAKSVSKLKKEAKSTIKTNAIRSAVTDAMGKKSDAKKSGFDFGGDTKGLNRKMRSVEEYSRGQEAKKSSGLKTKTARKVYSKAYQATAKKIEKANKSK